MSNFRINLSVGHLTLRHLKQLIIKFLNYFSSVYAHTILEILFSLSIH